MESEIKQENEERLNLDPNENMKDENEIMNIEEEMKPEEAEAEPKNEEAMKNETATDAALVDEVVNEVDEVENVEDK